MLRTLAIGSAFFLALGMACAQDPGAVFEKAPPDVESALRARVNQFYQYFVDGKFRLADALVAEDSKDTFFAAEKRRYKACVVGNITYSDNFTKAKAVTTCDTEYFFAANRFPVKLPIVSLWKLENGDWYWYVIPASEQDTYNSPFGPVKRPDAASGGQQTPDTPAAPSIPDPASVLARVRNGVHVDRTKLSFNGAKASKEEIHLKNTLPGRATIVAQFSGIPGLKVTPMKSDLGANGEVTMTFAFDPKDPTVNCAECLAHPQSRLAGTVTLRVEPTGQTVPVTVEFVTPKQQKEEAEPAASASRQ